MAWYKRIRDLREDSDKTQTDIAEVLETTAQYYGKYEKGERELPFNRAIQLADYYGISLDYLAGRSDFRTSHPLNDGEKCIRIDDVKMNINKENTQKSECSTLFRLVTILQKR